MNKKGDLKKRMDLTIYVRKIIHAFFLQRDCQNLLMTLRCVDEKCILGGLGDRAFLEGIQNVREALCVQKQHMENILFRIEDEWYKNIPLAPKVEVIYGCVHICGADTDDYPQGNLCALDEKIDFQLCFSVVFQEREEWRLTHMHLSVPQKDGELTEYVSGTLVQRFAETQNMLNHMRRLAEQDPVTSLYNHRAFFEMAEQMLQCENCYLMVLDLNQFKNINDTYGHLVGDDILKRTGEVLRAATRKNDIVGRVGGDEFAVLCVDVQTDEMALAIAERMVKDVNEQAGKAISRMVEISVGVARHHVQNTMKKTFEQADFAMYQIKRRHENGCKMYQGKGIVVRGTEHA